MTILLKFCKNKRQYVSKACFKFYVKIINNVRATVYQIAIPYDSKVEICQEIGHGLNYCDKIFY